MKGVGGVLGYGSGMRDHTQTSTTSPPLHTIPTQVLLASRLRTNGSMDIEADTYSSTDTDT